MLIREEAAFLLAKMRNGSKKYMQRKSNSSDKKNSVEISL